MPRIMWVYNSTLHRQTSAHRHTQRFFSKHRYYIKHECRELFVQLWPCVSELMNELFKTVKRWSECIFSVDARSTGYTLLVWHTSQLPISVCKTHGGSLCNRLCKRRKEQEEGTCRENLVLFIRFYSSALVWNR